MKPSEVIKMYGWCKADFGNDSIGYCLLGAIRKAYSASSYEHQGSIQCKLKVRLGVEFLAAWNDSPLRTKKEVIDLLESEGL